MTTENIEGLEEAEALIGRVGLNVAKRRGDIQKERAVRLKHEDHVAVGAAALLRRSKDERERLDEEEDQLDDIERMARALKSALDATDEPVVDDDEIDDSADPEPPAFVQPAPTAPPSSPDDEDRLLARCWTREELQRMTNAELTLLARWYADYRELNARAFEVHDFNRNDAVSFIVESQAIWCASEECDDPNCPAQLEPSAPIPPTTVQPTVTPPSPPYDPRSWRFPCLILAVLAALAGILLGILTRNVVSDEVDNVQWLVSLIWIVASGGVGFYLVGVICAFVHDRNRRGLPAK